MKKVLLAGGAGLLRFFAILAVLGISFLLAPSSFAQVNTYSLEFVGIPEGSIDLTQYIGLDRKLKRNVPGQTLRLSVTPPLTIPRKVRLSIVVSGSSSSVSECNTQIATATTSVFEISGSGRDLGSSDFTGSSGIGIQNSTENQRCIDALANKMQSGVAAIPTGIYSIDATLNDATTGAPLASGGHAIKIESASTVEAVLNLTSPQNGDQVPVSASVVFSFDNSIPGRLLAFEHSNIGQSPDDATRDLNSSLKMLDVTVTERGTNQVVANYPGVALRPWMAGKKVSWLFLGQMPGSSDFRRSAVWSFMVVPSDPLFNQLATALSSAPDPVGSTYTNLMSSGYMLAYSTANPLYLQEGEAGTRRTLDINDFLTLMSDLSRRSIPLTVTVTTQ